MKNQFHLRLKWTAFIIVVLMWSAPLFAFLIHRFFYQVDFIYKSAAWGHVIAMMLLAVSLPFTFRTNPVIGRVSLVLLSVSVTLIIVSLGD